MTQLRAAVERLETIAHEMKKGGIPTEYMDARLATLRQAVDKTEQAWPWPIEP